MASTSGASLAASSTDSRPITWITWIKEIPGSASCSAWYVPEERRSQIWMQLVRQARCCLTISSTSWRDVRRKVAIGGGTEAAISVINSSLITPGPLGIFETRPSAEAPSAMACSASSLLAIQQIFTRGRSVRSMLLLLAVGDPDVFYLRRVLEIPAALGLSAVEPVDRTAFVRENLF